MSSKLEKKIERWREKASELKGRRDPEKAADLVREGVDLKRKVDEKLESLLPTPPRRGQ